MSDLFNAVMAGAGPDELAGLPLPETYRAAVVRRDEVDMFEGLDSVGEGPPQVPPHR